MRKNIFIIFIVILVFFIGSCTKNDKKASEEIAQPDNSVEITVDSDEPDEEHATDAKQEADDIVLDSEESFKEITFSIPSTWSVKEENDILKFYPDSDNDTFIYLSYSDITSFPVFDIYDKEAFEQNMVYRIDSIASSAPDFALISNKTEEFIDGRYYSLINYSTTITDEKYEFYLYIIYTNTAAYTLALAQPYLDSAEFDNALTRIFESFMIDEIDGSFDSWEAYLSMMISPNAEIETIKRIGENDDEKIYSVFISKVFSLEETYASIGICCHNLINEYDIFIEDENVGTIMFHLPDSYIAIIKGDDPNEKGISTASVDENADNISEHQQLYEKYFYMDMGLGMTVK